MHKKQPTPNNYLIDSIQEKLLWDNFNVLD